MANSVHWNGHVLKREDSDVLRRALHIKVESKRKKGRLKLTWKQVEGECTRAGFNRVDAHCQSKWIVGINQIATRLR